MHTYDPIPARWRQKDLELKGILGYSEFEVSLGSMRWGGGQEGISGFPDVGENEPWKKS